MTDYTDPTTVDVDTVIGNINHDHRTRGHKWDKRPSWPNVTVKALADEVLRLRARLADFDTIETAGPGDFVIRDRLGHYSVLNADDYAKLLRMPR